MSRNECERTDNAQSCFIRVGYAYIPVQTLGKVYTPERAIIQGTIFPELDLTIGEYERGLYDGK